MNFILAILQLLFILSIAGVLTLFVIAFALSWTRHQEVAPQASLFDILTVAAVEWGAWITLGLFMLKPSHSFFEAPPERDQALHPHQIPIIFIPSLHTNGRIFNSLRWRFEQNFCTSLWIFSWRAAISEPQLLETQIVHFLQDVLENTRSRSIRIISFGSSRPLVARALDRAAFETISIRWICISGAAKLSKTHHFLHTRRLLKTYQLPFQRVPDRVLIGEHDLFQYPISLFDHPSPVVLEGVGHYASLLHSATIQTILKDFEIHGTLAFHHR